MGLPEPYYRDEAVTLYHADCRDVLPLLAPGSVDLVLTDPPYAPACHAGARTGDQDTALVDFAPITDADLRLVLDECGRVVRRWVVATMDWRHICELERRPPAGLRFVRFGVWVKPNGAPQFTGDRPGPGWEGLAFLHREGGRMRWNGGGRSSVFIEPKVETKHPTGKPERLIRQFTALFSDPGELILDPFAGSGTTLRAAKDLGRRAIGIEIEERYCEIAARRLAQSVLPLDIPA